jgi:negative regulator of flagellin synthesis FlgM
MKIGQPSDKPVNGATGGARTESTKGSGRSGSTSGASSLDDGVEASAKVTLSNLAGNLLSGADPTFNTAKVNSVKAAIDNGTYQVNPEVIADKLIANAKELLGREPS